jgi:hypothetical protein
MPTLAVITKPLSRLQLDVREVSLPISMSGVILIKINRNIFLVPLAGIEQARESL